MLVVLRLCLGFHFLYEGVWKVKNPDKFNAEPFLTQAKGPAAPLFYNMAEDVDGRERLQLGQVLKASDFTIGNAEKYRKASRAALVAEYEATSDAAQKLAPILKELDDNRTEAEKTEESYTERWQSLVRQHEVKQGDAVAVEEVYAAWARIENDLEQKREEVQKIQEKIEADTAQIAAMEAALAADGAEAKYDGKAVTQQRIDADKNDVEGLEQRKAYLERRVNELEEANFEEQIAAAYGRHEKHAPEEWEKVEQLAAQRDEVTRKLQQELAKLEKEQVAIQQRLAPQQPPVDAQTAAIEQQVEDRYLEFQEKLEAYLDENEEQIIAFMAKVEKGENEPADLAAEVKPWLAEIQTMEEEYQAAVKEALAGVKSQAAKRITDPIPYRTTVPDLEQDLQLSVVEQPKMLSDTFEMEIPRGHKFVTKTLLVNKRPLLAVEDTIPGEAYHAAWDELVNQVTEEYSLSEEQKVAARRIGQEYKSSVATYLDDNLPDIAAYLATLDRFEQRREKVPNNAPYQKKRDWEKYHGELRGGVKVWLADLEKMGEEARVALWDQLDEDQKAKGMFGHSWTFMRFTNFAVTWGLTAIGLCLLLGLFSNFAALGGAAFMVFVIATQPNLPGIYPPPTGPEGHALLVDKNFIEMIALLVIAVTPTSVWAGLDFFLWRGICKPLCCRNKKKAAESAE